MTATAMTVQPVPKVARRRQRTRTALLNAGHSLFATRAMESVTIDEIVAAADVAKGSFYNHFDDREGLASAITDQVQADCEVRISQANLGVEDAASRVVRALCVMVAYGLAHPERLKAMLSLSQRRTIASTPLNAGVAGDVASGLKAGRFSGVSLEVGVVIVIGLVRTTVAHVIAEASAPKDLTATIGAALLRALGLTEPEATALAQAAAADSIFMEVAR